MVECKLKDLELVRIMVVIIQSIILIIFIIVPILLIANTISKKQVFEKEKQSHFEY